MVNTVWFSIIILRVSFVDKLSYMDSKRHMYSVYTLALIIHLVFYGSLLFFCTFTKLGVVVIVVEV